MFDTEYHNLEPNIFKFLMDEILSALIDPTISYQSVIDTISTQIGKAVDADIVCVYAIEDERCALVPHSRWSSKLESSAPSKIPYLSLNAIFSKLSSDTPLYIDHQPHLLGPYISDYSASFCLAAYYPIYINDELLGFMGIFSSKQDSDIYRAPCLKLVAKGIATLFMKSHCHSQIEQNNEDLSRVLSELRQMQAQLVQQEKMVGIGQLAAGVAHEINNPLGYVASNFETLTRYIARMTETLQMQNSFLEHLSPYIHETEDVSLKKDFDDLMKAYSLNKMPYVLKDINDLLEDSKNGFQRVSDVINSLRNFARTDNGYRHEAHNLKMVIDEVMQILGSEIRYVASVTKEIDPYIELTCNRSEIGQVMLNLILNAIQAIRENESKTTGKLTVRAYRKNDDIFIEVEDDGPGISQEAMPHIFDPFYTTKEIGIGTGLGLSISYDIIVNKHGGEITAESHIGSGTIFRLIFHETLGGL